MKMRKYINYLCLAAFAATVMVACSKSDITGEVPAIPESPASVTVPVKKVSFRAKSANPGTKTVFGEKTSEGYPTVWTTSQKVSISLNYGSAVAATVVPATDPKTASFEATISSTGSAPYVFYALSPAVAASSWNSGNSSVTVKFPASQTPSMESVDEAAHIMAAKSTSYTEFPAESDPVSLSFAHIAAYGKFMLKNFPENVTISSIDLTADENIVGTVDYNPATGAYSDNSASKTLTINASAISAESNASKVFWFAVKPVNLEGKNLMVVIHTSGGDYIKNINFPSGKGNFVAGQVAAFNINMNGIAPATEKTATVNFGSNNVVISGTKITKCLDSQNNNWNVTTDADCQKNWGYVQIGDSDYEASSITFTTTLPAYSEITNMSAVMKGDDDSYFTVSLKVGDKEIGSRDVNENEDVTISSRSTDTPAYGKVLTIYVSNISDAVFIKSITVTYKN